MSKAKLLEYRVKKTAELLKNFDVKISGLKLDETGAKPYLQCTVNLSDTIIPFRFYLDKLGRRFERELQRLDKGCYCGTIRLEDVKTLFIALSTPINVYKHRSKLRRVAGLVKDKKLQKYLIWRRIKSKELLNRRQINYEGNGEKESWKGCLADNNDMSSFPSWLHI